MGEISTTSVGAWPWATLAVNASGAFALAVLLTLATERIAVAPWVRPLLGTGLLGAYTTFSALSLETEQMMAAGRVTTAIAYAATSVVGGLAAAFAGVAAVRAGGRRTGAPR